MEGFNPVEWFSWMYGRFFQGHPWVGGTIVVLVVAVGTGVLWVRGVDKYNEKHPQADAKKEESPVPKPMAATSQNKSRNDVAATVDQNKPKNSSRHNVAPATRAVMQLSVRIPPGASHLHFKRMFAPNGVDIDGCTYCSFTDSNIGSNNVNVATVTFSEDHGCPH